MPFGGAGTRVCLSSHMHRILRQLTTARHGLEKNNMTWFWGFWGERKTLWHHLHNSDIVCNVLSGSILSVYSPENYYAWFLYCAPLVHVACCVCAFWVTGANAWAFDPCYFQWQTIDFNYQSWWFSATAPSPACVPRSADEVRVISCNVAAGMCHFQSVLPIAAEGNLMAFIHPSSSCWGMTPLCDWLPTDRDSFSLWAWGGPEKKCAFVMKKKIFKCLCP